MLSKILLLIALFMLASKLGLRGKLRVRLRELKPKLDRAVNITIVVVVVAYVGQLLWLWLRKPGSPLAPPVESGAPDRPAGG